MQALRWVVVQADRRGDLPEQVPARLLHSEHNGPWVRRWGETPGRVLWSHAQYLFLRHALEGIEADATG